MEKEHQCLQNKDFVILSNGFRNYRVKKKDFRSTLDQRSMTDP